MSRRSFLRGVGAMFAAAGAANARVAAPGSAAVMPGAGFVGSAMGAGPIEGLQQAVMAKPLHEAPGWKAFRALAARQDRLESRRRQVTAMLGGYPPHLASMHSNAPWFRAQRAMAWEEGQRSTVEAYLDRMRQELLGGKPDGGV